MCRATTSDGTSKPDKHLCTTPPFPSTQQLSNVAERRQHLPTVSGAYRLLHMHSGSLPGRVVLPGRRLQAHPAPNQQLPSCGSLHGCAGSQRLADDPSALFRASTSQPSAVPLLPWLPPAAHVNATAGLNTSGRSLSGSFCDTGVELQLPSCCATRLLKDLWDLRRRTLSPLMPPQVLFVLWA